MYRSSQTNEQATKYLAEAMWLPASTVDDLKTMYTAKLHADTLRKNSRTAIAVLELDRRKEEFDSEREHFEVLKQAQRTLDEASPQPLAAAAAVPAAVPASMATPAAMLLAAAAPAAVTRAIPTPPAIVQYELLSAVAAHRSRQK